MDAMGYTMQRLLYDDKFVQKSPEKQIQGYEWYDMYIPSGKLT